MAGHRFDPEHAAKLLDPRRNKFVSPQQVIDILEIKQGDSIADLGAGNGFFTLPLAECSNVHVYAVDIEEQMLAMLRERATQARLSNIDYILSDLENIQLPNKVVNKALLSFVLHEVPNLNKALSELHRILKPEGIVLVIEWEAKEMSFGPPFHERIPSEELIQTLEENGFTVTNIPVNDVQYALKLQPAKASST